MKLAFRMIRNAVSTLFLVLSLGFAAFRLAPLYLSPEAYAALQVKIGLAMSMVTGRSQATAPTGPGSQDFMKNAQADLLRQLQEIRDRTAADADIPSGLEPLPAPKQPRFQPSARPAYGGVAPRSNGPKVIRVGE